ncbi:MAG: DUF86 domain-containing protein [Acidithiobacillus sp.]|nr:DUF86 domain-containing protein [Acidithiobacillus sp.]
MNKALRVPDYLGHILEAIERIDRYTKSISESIFMNNTMVQDAVIRNIEIIGEASNNIQCVDPEFAMRHKDIPWRVMYTMRNRVAHGYDEVDLKVVWTTVQDDLSKLYKQVQDVVQNLPSDNSHLIQHTDNLESALRELQAIIQHPAIQAVDKLPEQSRRIYADTVIRNNPELEKHFAQAKQALNLVGTEFMDSPLRQKIHEMIHTLSVFDPDLNAAIRLPDTHKPQH